MFKSGPLPVIGYIFCCFLLTFVSGVTHPAAVLF